MSEAISNENKPGLNVPASEIVNDIKQVQAARVNELFGEYKNRLEQVRRKLAAIKEREEAEIQKKLESELKKQAEMQAAAKKAEQEKLEREKEAALAKEQAAIAEEKAVSAQTEAEEAKPAPEPAAPAVPAAQTIKTRVFTAEKKEFVKRPQQQAQQQNAQSKPQQGQKWGGARPSASVTPPPAMPSSGGKDKFASKKKTGTNQGDDKKGQNRKSLIRKGFIVTDGGYITADNEWEGNTRIKSSKKVKKNEFIQPQAVKIESAVITVNPVPIKVLSEKIGKTGTEIIKQLFLLDIVKTINESIDFETAELVADTFGITLEFKPEKTAEELLIDTISEADEDESLLRSRPPVVTIMGHVDHGKTSLLDYIRNSNVASGEAGGITQHIGAYTVSLNGSPITFLDTPGHEAFTAMRMRGAQVTDIAIIVVAADDGIMPQTIEAINHAKAAGVSIIVAVNKMDKPTANPDRVLQQMTEYGLLPEAWGGDTPVVNVSAKTGQNVNQLLETVLLVAEMLELKANPDRAAKGVIVEAKLDKGRGPLATVLVQNGTLKVSDFVVAGEVVGKIRAMIDDKGRSVKEAGPATPVSVLGFSEVPNAGDQMTVVADEKLAKQVAEERRIRSKEELSAKFKAATLEDIFGDLEEGAQKDLNIIVKADVQGSVEAIKQALVKLTNNEVKINIIHGAVGAVNESDVMLAKTSMAIIIGFNVRPDTNAKSVAERDGIDIRCYRVIYDAIDDVEKAIKGMLEPKFKEVVLGRAEVRQIYKISGVGVVAGCMVTDGKIVRSAKVRLLRDNIVVYDGVLSSLKRFKDDAKEVAKGYDCGMSIANYSDVKEGDVIEAYNMEQIDEQ